MLRLLHFDVDALVQFVEIPVYELQANVRVDGALMKLGFFLGLLRDHVEKIVPYLVLEEDFCALHFEANVKDLKIDLLIRGELIEAFDGKLEFQEELLLDFLDEFLDGVKDEVLCELRLSLCLSVLHQDHLDDFIEGEAIFS